MEIGIDSFAAQFNTAATTNVSGQEALAQLPDRIEYADKMGLHSFGLW
jgi:hypothetical protein